MPDTTGSDRSKELEVMGKIASALKQLGDDDSALRRVLGWAADAHGVNLKLARPQGAVTPGISGAPLDSGEYEELAALFAASRPSTEPEKVLVVAYWFTRIKNQVDIESQQVNTELKQMGEGCKNITMPFTALLGRKPQLIIQTRKEGTARQARKKFKLTTAGIKEVERMLATVASEDEA